MYHIKDRQRPNTAITFPFILPPTYTSSTILFILVVVNILVLCQDRGLEIRAKTFRTRLYSTTHPHSVLSSKAYTYSIKIAWHVAHGIFVSFLGGLFSKIAPLQPSRTSIQNHHGPSAINAPQLRFLWCQWAACSGTRGAPRSCKASEKLGDTEWTQTLDL